MATQRILTLLILPALMAAAPFTSAFGKDSRPNIVVVLVDDMGFSDLGCYGGEIDTPNLDRLAAEGLQFTQFYNTAKCSPTRATLLSGIYYTEVGGNAMRNCMTIAEVLRTAGYTTLMTGKWHLGSTPVQRGFDRYFGHLSGCTNFFKGDNTFRLDDEPFKVPDSGFYTTDANTDYAMQFVTEAAAKEKPFFLYIAYNAPHYPLQAWKKDIDKYVGKYMKGWDELRKERYRRQLDMGLVQKNWPLSPRPGDVKAWDELTEEQKKIEDLTFATYAAMIDRVDVNIGKLMAKLKDLSVDENTLFLFMSDNGGCPFQRTKNRDIPPWSPDSYWTYHTAWANASNTPFRLYKRNQHEGGIATPLIAHWPAVIKEKGKLVHQLGHLVDIMATCVDVARAKYPETFHGQTLKPLRGTSLLPIFKGGRREDPEVLYFTFSNHHAIRMGKWKLVSVGGGPWELYDLEADRTELNDLAEKLPERAQKMEERWTQWKEQDWAKGSGKGPGRKKKREKQTKRKGES